MNKSVREEIPCIQITTMGGCHGIGHFLGPVYGYNHHVQQLVEAQNMECKLHSHVYVTMDKMMNYYDSLISPQPDILILQMGNYEFEPSLRADIRRFLKYKIQRKKSDIFRRNLSSMEDRRKKETIFIPSQKHLFNQQIKHIANWFLGYRYLRLNRWEKIIDQFYASIKQRGIKHVLVLSPTPHSGIVTNNYRRKGAELLERKSREAGFEYIDIQSELILRFGAGPMFIDENHLCREPLAYMNERIGEFVQEAIKMIPALSKDTVQ